jgi:hypothetical protein
VLGHLADEPELDQLSACALVYSLVTEIIKHGGRATHRHGLTLRTVPALRHGG